MPAIVAVVAKVMALVDAMMEWWVDVQWINADLGYHANPFCFPSGINAEVTGCGNRLAVVLGDSVELLASLGSQLLQAVGAITTNAGAL